MFATILCVWFFAAWLGHLFVAGFFGGFFRAFITGQFWYGVLFTALAIFVLEAVYKLSIGQEGDEYARTYIGKAWHFLYALYEKITHKAESEKQKLAADIRRHFR